MADTIWRLEFLDCYQWEGKARWVTTIPQPNSFATTSWVHDKNMDGSGTTGAESLNICSFLYESFFYCYNKILEVEVLNWGLFGSWLWWLESTNNTTLASQKGTSGYISAWRRRGETSGKFPLSEAVTLGDTSPALGKLSNLLWRWWLYCFLKGATSKGSATLTHSHYKQGFHTGTSGRHSQPYPCYRHLHTGFPDS